MSLTQIKQQLEEHNRQRAELDFLRERSREESEAILVQAVCDAQREAELYGRRELEALIEEQKFDDDCHINTSGVYVELEHICRNVVDGPSWSVEEHVMPNGVHFLAPVLISRRVELRDRPVEDPGLASLMAA